MESIAYQIRDGLDFMMSESGIQLQELRADGGATRNKTFMQFQADLLGRPIVVPKTAELSAMGATFAGGLGLGIWKESDLDQISETKTKYFPYWDETQRIRRYQGWREAVRSVMEYTKYV